MKRRLKVLSAFVLVFFTFFVLGLLGIWRIASSAPDIDSISVRPVGAASYICDQNGRTLRKLAFSSSNRDIVALDQISRDLRDAVVAIEDERFFEHGGIDIRGIVRAFWNGISNGSFSEGASTITQQLIKNSVFTDWMQESSFADRFRRKVQEQYLALQLERRMSKDEILEHYLNTINFGEGCYGIQAAAQRYLGKDAADLSLSESAVLAAIPQNPSAMNPIRFPETNRSRQETILQYMLEQEFISDEEYALALGDDVYQRIAAYNSEFAGETVYSWYEDALIEQAADALIAAFDCTSDQAYRAIYSGGLRIFSAQDPALQQICDEEFQNPENFPEDLPEMSLSGTSTASDSDTTLFIIQPQASLVLMDQQTGLVRALVGGRGEKTGSLLLNRATETLRQPGSTFKILTAYAPALDTQQQTLATSYENDYYEYEDGTPVSNWDVNDYSGSVTMREAITRSVNIAAVKCITEITPQLGFDYARNFGISTLHESYEQDGRISTDVIQPLALGGITEGVTNLELCAAFATIANGGIRIQPKFFTKILDQDGAVILDFTETARSGSDFFPADTEIENSVSDSSSGLLSDSSAALFSDSAAALLSDSAAVQGSRILHESTAFLLTSAMQDVVSDPQGTASGSIYASGHPVAGKTGTTSNYKDIWFTGYTPYYTCSVWGGCDDNRDLPDGSSYHSYSKTLWSAVMNRVHAELPVKEFVQPETVVTAVLCSKSHQLAVPSVCPHTYTEYFAESTQPEKMCSLHRPAPQTEPIVIYQDLLDQILTETEEASESETETAIDSGIESESDANKHTEWESDPNDAENTDSEENSGNNSEGNTEILPENGTEEKPEDIPEVLPETDAPNIDYPNQDTGNQADGPETLPPEPGQPETSSLDDLLKRLNL